MQNIRSILPMINTRFKMDALNDLPSPFQIYREDCLTTIAMQFQCLKLKY